MFWHIGCRGVKNEEKLWWESKTNNVRDGAAFEKERGLNIQSFILSNRKMHLAVTNEPLRTRRLSLIWSSEVMQAAAQDLEGLCKATLTCPKIFHAAVTRASNFVAYSSTLLGAQDLGSLLVTELFIFSSRDKSCQGAVMSALLLLLAQRCTVCLIS